MPIIKFSQNKKPAIQTDTNSNLMATLLAHQVPVASSCHGEGVCCKCRMTIIEGGEQLSPITEQEEILRAKNNLKENERVSCQVQILGNITIDAGYW